MSSSTDSDQLQTATINNRRWYDVSTQCDGDDDDSAAKFRLATYNILSDNAVKPGEYLYCPSQLRYMNSRHDRIITEIRNMQPHVVCFQVSLTLCMSLYVSLCLCLSVCLFTRLISLQEFTVARHGHTHAYAWCLGSVIRSCFSV